MIIIHHHAEGTKMANKYQHEKLLISNRLNLEKHTPFTYESNTLIIYDINHIISAKVHDMY